MSHVSDPPPNHQPSAYVLPEQMISLPSHTADLLIGGNYGDSALLYLFMLRYRCFPNWMPERLAAAQEHLHGLGLLPRVGEQSAAVEPTPAMPPVQTTPAVEPTPAVQPTPATPVADSAPVAEAQAVVKVESNFAPEYTSRDLILALEGDSVFQGLFQSIQQSLGKALGDQDTKYLLEIYHHFELPTEVILMLVTYCVKKQNYGNNGGKRPPSLRSIKQEAARWYNQGIVTVSRAIEFTDKLKDLSQQQQEVVSLFSLNESVFTTKMQNDLKQWNDWGFDMDCYALAYERCLDGIQAKTGDREFQWNYCNGIFRTWHKQGVHSRAEILAYDNKNNLGFSRGGNNPMGGKSFSKGPYANDTLVASETQAPPPAQAKQMQEDMDYMKKILSQLPST